MTKSDLEEEVTEIENEEVTEFEERHLEASIEKAADGSFVAVASTNAVDRHGEIVDNNGWELKAFKKNPVILWAHNHEELPIGFAKKVWVDGTGKKAKLMIQPVLHDVTEKARAIKTLVDMGVIKALSVGFKPLESPDGVTFTKNELLEVSMVSVPANAEAMALAYKGLKSKEFSDEILEDLGINKIVSELIDKVDYLTETVEKSVKAQETVNPKMEAKERLSMIKIISRATDKLLEGEKKNLPQQNRIELMKVQKRAAEILATKDLEKVR